MLPLRRIPHAKVSEKLMDGAAAMGFRDRSKRRSSLPVSSLSNRRRSSSASAGSTSCKPKQTNKQIQIK